MGGTAEPSRGPRVVASGQAAVLFLLAVTAFPSCPELAWGPYGAFRQVLAVWKWETEGTGWFLKGPGEGGLILHPLPMVFLIMLISPAP